MYLRERRSLQSKRLGKILGCHFNCAWGWWCGCLEEIDTWADPGPNYQNTAQENYPPPILSDPLEVEAAADWDGAEGALIEAMIEAGFLRRHDDGTVDCPDYWQKYAGTHVYSRLRKRKHDAGKREKPCNVTVTPSNVTVTPKEKESKNEKETEKESVNIKTEPNRTESNPESVRIESVGFSHVNDSGPEHVGAIAAALVAAHPPDEVKALLPQKIMNLTKEQSEYLPWWAETVERLDNVGELQILRDAANHVKSPEGGGIKKPAAYLAKQCQEALKRHGRYLPQKPEGLADVIPF